MALPWFRMYAEIVDDEIIQFLSFDDQRHYVWILALKCSGLLDKQYPKEGMLDVVVGRKLGLQGEALTNAKQRILEIGLIDERWQPTAWNKRQFVSDVSDPTAAERMRRYRENHKNQEGAAYERNNRNATVTSRLPETDTESEADTNKNNAPPGLDLAAWQIWVDYRKQTRKPIKPASVQAAQRAMAKFGPDQATVVEHCIANGYQGLYAPKNHGGNNAAGQRIDNSARGRVRRANGLDTPEPIDGTSQRTD